MQRYFLRPAVAGLMLLTGLCLGSVPARAEFVLEPAQLTPGGMAMVRWVGMERPLRPAVVFRGRPLPVYERDGVILSLIGIDRDEHSGTETVTAAWYDQRGQLHSVDLPLTMEVVARPVERLQVPKQMATPTDPAILKRIRSDQKRLARIFAQSSPQLHWGAFARPVPGNILSPFGLRRVLNGVEKSPHNGVDFRAPAGSAVTAAGAGQVALAADLYYTGKTVLIDHGGGLFTLYAHLQSFAVQPGAAVTVGTLLGAAGSTGRSTGPHLHFGLRMGRLRLDPLSLLQLYAPAGP